MTMQSIHRTLGSWRSKVDRFIAASEFARVKFAQGGLPAAKIVVKPNFVDPDPKPGRGDGGYFLYVGRLSEEKGLGILLEAWLRMGPLPDLRIVGDGPMSYHVKAVSAQLAQVEWLGPLPLTPVLDLIGSARYLIVPSTCFENFPRVIAEAFAKGTPVIASNHGAMGEIVADGHTGFLVTPGDYSALARTVVRARDLEQRVYHRQRSNARAEYELQFTAERNYNTLLETYRQVITPSRSTV
jgi:glycosyltransferase involved in cell wall biosynthesis